LTEPLLSNGRYTAAYFVSVAEERVYTPHYDSDNTIKLLIAVSTFCTAYLLPNSTLQWDYSINILRFRGLEIIFKFVNPYRLTIQSYDIHAVEKASLNERKAR
jgi:hypothetical protein